VARVLRNRRASVSGDLEGVQGVDINFSRGITVRLELCLIEANICSFPTHEDSVSAMMYGHQKCRKDCEGTFGILENPYDYCTYSIFMRPLESYPFFITSDHN